ncbi:ankyrin repeat domain-containing protein [Wolbachia endosymbiont of Drosophila leontia]|uniref:ankyrin repeat domain-containing protein n=1 Tax=Wolbachia endosymbiont of Drosophila leontia TaxID=3002580 RepID=UPI0023A95406|nr:ankyrin repeat domain-containing protein [Wolbachia endosymbiont of Drosophila leontia]MDE5067401.1 ankyrin repeat domain-containing protein [Wolbachia endosymbiont of Drosophila leontia]
MGIDITALTTNADKLGECIDKNKKQEQDRKDEQLYGIIERKVKKEEHKREKPRGQDETLKKCKRLFEEGASSEVLTKLEESLREQEKYYRYYVQCFLPVLDKAIERSKKISNETKERVKQAISEITYNSRYCFTHNRRDSETESGYGSDVEDDHEVEISNEITNNNALLLKAIKNGNNRKFRKYLKDCTDISSIKAEEGKNILHLIASLEKKQKCKFLGTLIKTVTKEDLAQLVDSENQTPFQAALINKVTKEKHESHTIQDNDNTLKFLTKLLEHGASSDNLGLSTKKLQDLKEEQKTYYRNFLEKLAEQGKKSKLKPEIRINTEAKIKEIIPRTINTPDSNDNYQLHLAIKDNDKERFEELLQKGADITVQDKDGKNALHYIASFKGEQKVTCLELILGLVKNGTISKDKLGKAINAKNGEGNTPLELALKNKAEKRSIKHLLQGTIFDTATAYDNTTKFCTMLLEIGADPCSLELKNPKFHTKKYYLTLRDLKDYSGTPQKAQEKAKELKEKLEEKYHCGTASKKCKSGIKKLDSAIKKTGSAVAGFIDPAKRTRELLAITITITVIAMVTFAFFQGQMAIGAAIPIIATAGVICLTLTLGFSGIKKLFEKSTNKAQDTFNDKNRSNSTTEQNQASKNLVNNDQQNLRNETKNQAVQESPNQSEHTESPPDTKMSAISIMNSLKNCVGIV